MKNLLRRLVLAVCVTTLMLGIAITTSAAPKKVVVAQILPDIQGLFHVASAVGFKTEAERLGYEAVIVNADFNLEKQISQLKTFLARKVDGVALAALDSYAVIPAIKDLRKAGIPVIAVDRAIDDSSITSTIITDNVTAGAELGKYALKVLNGKPAKALVIQGNLNALINSLRCDGFLSAIKSSKDYEVIGMPVGDWQAEKAYDAVVSYMKTHPEINVIFSASDVMDPGIVSGLKAVGRLYPAGDPRHVVVVSIDGGPEGLDLVRKKYVTAVFSQQPYLIGVWAVKVLQQHIEGRSEDIPKALFFSGDVVTFENINTFHNLWGDQKWDTSFIK